MIIISIFLKKRRKLNEELVYSIFDDARLKRNSLVYYGKIMDLKDAKLISEKIKKLIEKLA